jgi:hypothetical protein
MKQIFRLRKEDAGEIILGILIVIFLIMGYKLPEPFESMLNSLFGKIILFILVIYMFMNSNPYLAILLLFVIFSISMSTSKMIMTQNNPSETIKSAQFTAFNQFPYTLEQEVVKQMAPIMTPGVSMTKATYKPSLDNTYSASPINSN